MFYLEVFNETKIKAEKMFNIDCSDLMITVDEKPRDSKACAFYKQSTQTVHLNKVTLMTFSEKALTDLIIHEIAHHVTTKVYPRAKQSHGPEFKMIDRLLGGLGKTYVQSVECCKAFTDIVNKGKPKAQTFKYACSGVNKCTSFEFTKNRHTRVLNGSTYICPECKSFLSQDI